MSTYHFSRCDCTMFPFSGLDNIMTMQKIGSYLCLASVIFVGPAVLCYKYSCLNCLLTEASLTYIWLIGIQSIAKNFTCRKVIRWSMGCQYSWGWGIKKILSLSESLFMRIDIPWLEFDAFYCYILLFHVAYFIKFFYLVKGPFALVLRPYAHFWLRNWFNESLNIGFKWFAFQTFEGITSVPLWFNFVVWLGFNNGKHN